MTGRLFGDEEAGQFNSSRLVLARARRGLNQTELANRVGMAVSTIRGYESNRIAPPQSTVESIAKELNFPLSFFYAELHATLERQRASFRSLSNTSKRDADRALASGTLGIELSRWIDKRFELAEPDIPDVERQVGGTIDDDGPAKAAAAVRGAWGLGESPILHAIRLVEAHGVRVFSLARDCREVDAFSAWVHGVPYICLATVKTAERSIFDCIHELGHLVLHRGHDTPRGRQEELEANRFASAFLMPEADVRAHAPVRPTYEDLVEAKIRWRVSVAALAFRMRELRLLSEWHYREVCKDISRAGRGSEPNSIEPEASAVLSTVFDAMRAEGVSRSDIARDLHISRADLDALTFNLTMSSVEGGGQTSNPRRGHLRVATG